MGPWETHGYSVQFLHLVRIFKWLKWSVDLKRQIWKQRHIGTNIARLKHIQIGIYAYQLMIYNRFYFWSRWPSFNRDDIFSCSGFIIIMAITNYYAFTESYGRKLRKAPLNIKRRGRRCFGLGLPRPSKDSNKLGAMFRNQVWWWQWSNYRQN